MPKLQDAIDAGGKALLVTKDRIIILRDGTYEFKCRHYRGARRRRNG